MINALKSNRSPVYIEGFPVSKSQAEFDDLTFLQKSVLFEQRPAVYRHFTRKDEDDKQW